MQTALLKSACHVAIVQRDLVAKVEEFGLTQTPPRTQTLLGIFDGSLGTRFMSKAQKRKGGKGRLNWKAEHRDSFFVLPMTSWASTTADIPKKRLSTRLTTSIENLSSFLCSFTSLLQCELTRERDCEKPLWLLPLQFSDFGVATLFSPMIFCKIPARKKKWIKKLQEMPGKIAHVK